MKLRMNNLRMLGLFLAVLLVFSSCTDLRGNSSGWC